MKILGIRKDRRVNFTHVGASLPSRVNNYLTLYSMAKKVTKSKLIGELLDDWIHKQEEMGAVIEQLLNEIKQDCLLQWKLKKAKHGDRVSLLKYKKELSEDLTSKGVSEDTIYEIISEIK